MSLVRFRSEAPRKRPYAAACGRFSYVCGFRPCWPRGREIKASPAVVGGYESTDEPSLALLDLLGRVSHPRNSQRAKSHCVRLTRSCCAERNSPRNLQRQVGIWCGRAKSRFARLARSSFAGAKLAASQVSLRSANSVEFCWRKTRRGIRSDRTFQVLSFPIKMEGQSAGLAFHFWCGRQDLNLHGHPPEPKSGASANSATPAEKRTYYTVFR